MLKSTPARKKVHHCHLWRLWLIWAMKVPMAFSDLLNSTPTPKTLPHWFWLVQAGSDWFRLVQENFFSGQIPTPTVLPSDQRDESLQVGCGSNQLLSSVWRFLFDFDNEIFIYLILMTMSFFIWFWWQCLFRCRQKSVGLDITCANLRDSRSLESVSSPQIILPSIMAIAIGSVRMILPSMAIAIAKCLQSIIKKEISGFCSKDTLKMPRW